MVVTLVVFAKPRLPLLQAVKGLTCIWRANEEFVDRFNLALELPSDLVSPLTRVVHRSSLQAAVLQT